MATKKRFLNFYRLFRFISVGLSARSRGCFYTVCILTVTIPVFTILISQEPHLTLEITVFYSLMFLAFVVSYVMLALDLKRFIIEKQRADIIAASISDGIFLVKEKQILYMNPIAEKIIGSLDLPKSSDVRESPDLPDLENEKQLDHSPGLRAVKNAALRTFPVEFVLECDDRKLHYLIQSFPVNYRLVEKFGYVGPYLFSEKENETSQADSLVLAQDVTLVKDSQEAKAHFLANLSHEIKTPVTSLTMATCLLKKSIEQFPNPAHRNLISICSDNVDRLRNLLEDLLTISRFDSLAQRLEKQRVDFVKLLRHSVKSFETEAKHRGITLEHSIAKGGTPLKLSAVDIDPTKIMWALSNLMTNALKYTPRGGRVLVSIKSDENWIEVKVADTGPGIERSRRERIFNKFSSYYDLRVARAGNLGAGLAIAKEIIVAHGGNIWVNSQPGHGAEFCFTLPVEQSRSLNHSLNEMKERSV